MENLFKAIYYAAEALIIVDLGADLIGKIKSNIRSKESIQMHSS